MTDEFYMQLALDEAWKYQLLTYPNPAVGAIVVHNGRILSVEAHQKAGTSHAEVLALIGAYETLLGRQVTFDRFDAQKAHHFLCELPQGFFSQCTIYITLEPCSHKGRTPSCASLLQSLLLQRVVIGIKDPIEDHGGGVSIIQSETSPTKVTMGILQDACRALIEPFFIWQKQAFILFKLAQTTNARIGGGYLSSHSSLKHVHRLREVCSKLLIGGETVRRDRPTLDCRFIDGMAPDVVIYSRTKQFDCNIPLFDVKERDVTISNHLSFLSKPSFILVEGGEGMLNVLKDRIDWLLIYQTPKLSTNDLSYNIEMNLTFLHQQKSGVDMMIWSRQSGD
ncbi:MAG: bifunctional diaminohydroxyphosphoribosylaminopyrimidine deaminase/5-amino-6-(5-phosphoribosylamino)uracil reductase RibD [Sulfurovum sp.]|nr:bifunctional diaminohydroxyphosphoribosylaminopyrimidine deaminase/5-amino-6-(5-phosphoribosylamino)uracil reductase RibD [Sulfurovum sp.]